MQDLIVDCIGAGLSGAVVCARARQSGLETIESMFEHLGSGDASLRHGDEDPDVENPNIAELLADYVSMVDDAGGPPDWSSFAKERHKELLGNIHVLAMEPGGKSMRYRLFGSHVAHRYGRDLTGKPVPDNAANLGTVFHGLYLYSAMTGRSLYTKHHPKPDAVVKDCQRLILPFLNGSGGFHRLVVAHLPVKTPIGYVGGVI